MFRNNIHAYTNHIALNLLEVCIDCRSMYKCTSAVAYEVLFPSPLSPTLSHTHSPPHFSHFSQPFIYISLFT